VGGDIFISGWLIYRMMIMIHDDDTLLQNLFGDFSIGESIYINCVLVCSQSRSVQGHVYNSSSLILIAIYVVIQDY